MSLTKQDIHNHLHFKKRLGSSLNYVDEVRQRL